MAKAGVGSGSADRDRATSVHRADADRESDERRAPRAPRFFRRMTVPAPSGRRSRIRRAQSCTAACNAMVSRICRMLIATHPGGKSPGATLQGAFRIDIAEVLTAEAKPCLLVGIDRTARFAVARPVETADTRMA